jgi:hypothetical protein
MTSDPDPAAPPPAPKHLGVWTRFTGWLDASGGPALTIAFFSTIAAVLSALVALAQTLLLMNERSTPYRAPIHSAQVDAARQVAATAREYWESRDAGMLACRGLQSGDPAWSWEQSVKPRLDAEAQAFTDFRKATFSATVVMSERVLQSVEVLGEIVLRAGADYGARTCEESVKLDEKFGKDAQAFDDAYFAFVNTAREDASIDKLSERPDMSMPK